MTTASLTACPPMLVAAPRGSTGTSCCPAYLQRGQHVTGIDRLNDPDRDMPVVGGVRREHGPAGGIEADLSPDPGGQVSGQSLR